VRENNAHRRILFVLRLFFTRSSLTNGAVWFIILNMLKKKLKPQVGKKSLILLAVAAVLVAADLVTKYLEEKFVWSAKIIPGFIEISNSIRNPGCAFSFLNEHPEVGQPVLISLTFVLLAVLIFAFIFMPERFTLLKLAITVVIAGALGNLVDRLMFRSVRDFFGLNMFGMMTYCNLADFWIVIGTALAVIDLLFLNEWAVFPLTEKAKAAQAAKKAEEDKSENGNAPAANETSAESDGGPDEGTGGESGGETE